MSLWVNGLRPKTLPASIAPVLVGIAAGYPLLEAQAASCSTGAKELVGCVAEPSGLSASPAGVSWGKFVLLAVLCVVVALFIQIAANFANDYSDGIRGTDAGRGDAEVKTAKPQRLTVSGLVKPGQVLAAAGVNAFIACVAGLAITIITGHWWLIALGVLCLLAGWFYVGGKHPYGYAGFGEVGVFIFFGLVAVLGSEYVLAGRLDIWGVYGAVICGLYSCAILMVNNLRDVDEDKVSGKMTLGVRLGKRGARSVLLFVYFVCLAATVVLGFVGLIDLFIATQSVHFAGIILAVLALVLAVLAAMVGFGMINGVLAGNFVKALPMCSMTLLVFAVLFVIVKIEQVLLGV
ncbi:MULTISPECIES: 1,4-dihydroxy-2-naphthoate octaprenyltransferase [unclassified Bifidobacterium]|uniref:1,4-dihydroxy-2-naphthoate octaprenyltransferase n=1 Tax=unclassified Bifidobacterium TaxID=2608897 RepID=UPI0023F85BC8|nr:MULTISPECIES: 1,4-dihydroxy-2-naphthoate octaprenyltransferase [unclassified Bifidobacterium]WEV65400.1 1,4-dihydroxy-2-naphthoate octaprenyltransferase [Bifidobacterium sp. ESL0764]WEV75801.1 1,4-dihydroxy-2-naphthoate octaprenyltransferase [Bifidobacterium sp. ESL0800]